MKSYSIFLASSFELESERRGFEIFINRENKRLKNRNVFLDLEIWEDMDGSLNNGRKQDDYNQRLAKCDVCVVLFWTKVGKFTLDEFELAYQLYRDTERPKVFVYQKILAPDVSPLEWERKSKEEFLGRLRRPGKEQFPIQFSNYDELENKFKRSLDDLFEMGFLTYGEPAKMLSINGPAEPNYFIGRDEELKQIENRLSSFGKILMISSEGGLGKTTLAAKYWYDHLYKYKYNAWIYCENGILNSLKSLAPQLGISLKGLDEDGQMTEIQRALLNFHDDFLLVLDNANNEEDIFNFINKFKGFHWQVLITSRCKEILDEEEELAVSSLSPSDSRLLFLKYYEEDVQSFKSLLEGFLHAIGYNTLLIEIFAKNLKEASAVGMTMVEYIKKLAIHGLYLGEESFEVKTGYLEKKGKRSLTTDEILDILYDFSELDEDHRSLLINLALLPAERYSTKSLIFLFQPNDILEFAKRVKKIFEKGWLGGGGNEYRMSPIIQQVILKKSREILWDEAKILISSLNSIMSAEISSGEIGSFYEMVPIFEHIYPLFPETTEAEYARFLNNGSVLLYSIGGKQHLHQAKICLERAIVINEELFGSNSPEVNDFKSNYANLLRHLGGRENLLKAQSILDIAIKYDESNFEQNKEQVCRHYSNLGGVLRDLGGRENLLRAVEVLEKALKIDRSIIPVNERKIAIRNANLSLIYLNLGGNKNLFLALMKAKLAVAIYKNVSGDFSIDVVGAKGNLALILRTLGGDANEKKALSLAREALETSIKISGTNCYLTAKMQHILAETLVTTGNIEKAKEAEDLMLSSLSWSKENLSSDNSFLSASNYLLESIRHFLTDSST
jgi:hypothetical protein